MLSKLTGHGLKVGWIPKRSILITNTREQVRLLVVGHTGTSMTGKQVVVPYGQLVASPLWGILWMMAAVTLSAVARMHRSSQPPIPGLRQIFETIWKNTRAVLLWHFLLTPCEEFLTLTDVQHYTVVLSVVEGAAKMHY